MGMGGDADGEGGRHKIPALTEYPQNASRRPFVSFLPALLNLM